MNPNGYRPPQAPEPSDDKTFTKHYATFKWVKVKRHVLDENASWEQNYVALHEHHISETSFLIEEIRKLAAKLDEAGVKVPE